MVYIPPPTSPANGGPATASPAGGFLNSFAGIFSAANPIVQGGSNFFLQQMQNNLLRSQNRASFFQTLGVLQSLLGTPNLDPIGSPGNRVQPGSYEAGFLPVGTLLPGVRGQSGIDPSVFATRKALFALLSRGDAIRPDDARALRQSQSRNLGMSLSQGQAKSPGVLASQLANLGGAGLSSAQTDIGVAQQNRGFRQAVQSQGSQFLNSLFQLASSSF